MLVFVPCTKKKKKKSLLGNLQSLFSMGNASSMSSVIFTDWKMYGTSVRKTLAIFSYYEIECQARVLVKGIGADSSQFCINSQWRSSTRNYKNCRRLYWIKVDIGCKMLEGQGKTTVFAFFFTAVLIWKQYLVLEVSVAELIIVFECGCCECVLGEIKECSNLMQ